MRETGPVSTMGSFDGIKVNAVIMVFLGRHIVKDILGDFTLT